jgi:Leucine-rich repeat (LRR) protein
MTSLTTLWLRNNKLETLPETINGLSRVTQFFGNHNKLKTLPAEFGGMTSLIELRLHMNQLDYLPASLSQLQAVTIITMFDNKFTVFPAPVCLMKSVVHAMFARNEIKYVPFEVGAMVSLKSLDLEVSRALIIYAECTPLSQAGALPTRAPASKWNSLDPSTQLRSQSQSQARHFRALPKLLHSKHESLTTVGMCRLCSQGNYGLEELPMFLGDISQLKILSIECQAIQVGPLTL